MNQSQILDEQTQILDELDFYSNRENFLYEALFEYLPESEQFTIFDGMDNIDITFKDVSDQIVYSMKFTHFLVRSTTEAWPVFLDSVEKGFLLLEEQGLVVTGDTRLKMLLASSISGD